MAELLRVFYGVSSLSLIGALLGLGLSVASRRLAVRKGKKVEELLTALPGLDCGGCGYAGCTPYAEALASGEELDHRKCIPGGEETLQKVAVLLGVDSSNKKDQAKVKMVAALHCQGGAEETSTRFQYDGITDCRIAVSYYGGPRSCLYGCLGLGSCLAVCPTDAIQRSEKGLIEVDPLLCIGCEKCTTICPTGVLKMIPAHTRYFVACNSQDSGKETKNCCRVGCIGCRRCVREFSSGGFVMNEKNSLASVDHGLLNRASVPLEGVEKICPTNAILIRRRAKS